ncbi:type II toxin-antitoxin system death-on-curing family toxin [Acidaminococcus massiliensis]|jgi:death-on-curing protein|uniref:Maintenance system killer protein n=1 Tax=Siphoviridae sp. ctm7X10 TaxID=2827929 RepID=A0A8S5S524_9CAUD|nr:type II toxin-antitoxin system death-on-curing family toxin [Acidaminococcus massiliensis]DAF46041.1 MAG TPA: maintenance system killer protein [Siphoviridae sp. ctm7X10]
MIVLSKNQIIKLHSQLIQETGGTDGIRDEGLLESVLAAPFQSFSGTDIYPSLQQKAARLGYGLVKNHAFIDGNKRIGAHVMLVFLALNKIELTYTQDELSDTFLKIAAGELSQQDLLHWIIIHQE